MGSEKQKKTARKSYVFISHSSDNQANAETVARLLEENGFKTWMSYRDIPIGARYAEALTEAIKNCEVFLLLLTPEALNSVWVSKETERAINYRKTILAVDLFNKIELNTEFEMYLSNVQRLVLEDCEEESLSVQRLLSAVGSKMPRQKKTTVEFEIKKHIAVIVPSTRGWNLELNYVSWNGQPPKYDIRTWSPDHTRMGRGLTLTEEELTSLAAVLSKETVDAIYD